MAKKRRSRIFAAGWVPLVLTFVIWAECSAGIESGLPAGRADAKVPINANADEINYDRQSGWVIAKGNVVITKGNTTLTCNYARLNVKQETAHAYGNVVLTEGESVWRGESLDYDFGKKTGSATGISGEQKPFRVIRNDQVEKTGPNSFRLRNATVTTCTNAFHDCHYFVKAREVTLVPGDYMTLRGGVWYLGGLPVLYLPVWKKDLRNEYGWEVRPGHSSRLGAYLLTAYRYPISPMFKGRTHLDYRTRRGVALGQDVGWMSLTRGTGDLSLYFADDQEPIDDDEDATTADIDPERYRARFRHYVGLSPRDYVMTRLNYLSDTDVVEDFFEDEYRLNVVPENYVSYVHRGDRYTADLLVRGQLNDFFGGVNRLPQATFESFRQSLGESRFYYEGRTSLGFLERVYPESSTSDEYSSLRFDTVHTVYRPSKHFGFLNLVPRTGVRGTYYSDTRESRVQTEIVTVTQTNTVTGSGGIPVTTFSTSTQTNTATVEVGAGSGFRRQFELGLEASFKAFRVWDGGNRYEPSRHIVEPYANYTYLSEPNLLPGELYQFDSIDELDEANFVKLGVRNKFQVKRGGGAFDLIDVDLYTRVRFQTAENENTLDNVYMDTEVRPNDWVKIDLDGQYDTDENRIQAFNTQLIFVPKTSWEAAIEHRYLYASSSLLNGSLTLRPNRNWHFNTYGRYELEESRVQEQGGYVQRNFDCMAFRLRGRVLPSYTRSDGTERDTDYRVSLEFWLTDFPGFGVFNRDGS